MHWPYSSCISMHSIVLLLIFKLMLLRTTIYTEKFSYQNINQFYNQMLNNKKMRFRTHSSYSWSNLLLVLKALSCWTWSIAPLYWWFICGQSRAFKTLFSYHQEYKQNQADILRHSKGGRTLKHVLNNLPWRIKVNKSRQNLQTIYL